MKNLIKAIKDVYPVTVIEAVKVGDGTSKSLQDLLPVMAKYDNNIKSVNHRGWNSEAPENSLSAFKLSKMKGFDYIETDIIMTKDGVPVLSHNWDISLQSNGVGDIRNLTYEELSQYRLNKVYPSYTNEKYPTLEELIILCKNIGLRPYLELKEVSVVDGVPTDWTTDKIKKLVDIVSRYDMLDKVTWICFYPEVLSLIAECDNNARLGYLPLISMSRDEIINMIPTVASLREKTNGEVFMDARFIFLKDDIVVKKCKEIKMPIEVWTIDNENDLYEIDPYVSGYTSNTLIASKVLYNKNITLDE